MNKDLEIVYGQPFEEEWQIDYDIFDEDKIDSTIPFIIKNINNETVLSLEFNYGLTVIKFDHEDFSKILVSIFETDILEQGQYSYEYNPTTFSGKVLGNFTGKINVLPPVDSVPNVIREVRPWDLLRSKKPGEAGERASNEEQQKRISICEECPRFVKLTSQCLECGCIMKLKTKLKAATCPLGKW